MSVWVSVHETCVCAHVCVSACACVCQSLCLFAHSLHLTRAHIVGDQKIVSGRSPGLLPSGLELGRIWQDVPSGCFWGGLLAVWAFTVISQPQGFLVHEFPQAGPVLCHGKLQSQTLIPLYPA